MSEKKDRIKKAEDRNGKKNGNKTTKKMRG